MFFHFLFLLFFKFNVTDETVDQIISESYKIPIFLLIYSPHCGHCKKVHPEWLKLMDTYENDTGVIIAQCNAIEHSSQCSKLYQYTAYPTFVKYAKGTSLFFTPQRKYENFVNITEALKEIDYSTSCLEYEAFKGEYPSFVFNMVGVEYNKKQNCAIIEEVAKELDDPSLKKYLFMGEKSDKELLVYLSENQVISYSGKSYSKSGYKQFINEYSFKQFSEFSSVNPKHLLSYNRRLALFVYDEYYRRNTAKSSASDFFSDFVFVNVHKTNFFNVLPDLNGKVTPPFFAVADNDRKLFYIKGNMSRALLIQQFLNETKDGNFEGSFNLSALVPAPLRVPGGENQDILDEGDKIIIPDIQQVENTLQNEAPAEVAQPENEEDSNDTNNKAKKNNEQEELEHNKEEIQSKAPPRPPAPRR